ncbi:MAG: cobalamin-independent methionine synthase II family protein [Burkholderiales bacterium]
MKRSTDRILTTHVGRLQRPEPLTEAMMAQPQKRPSDTAFTRLLADSVTAVVREQADAGVDVVNDGEFGKLSWHTYLMQRMAGFEIAKRAADAPRDPPSLDRRDFGEFYAWLDKTYKYYRDPGGEPPAGTEWVCTGPISYSGAAAIAEDTTNLAAGVKAAKVEEAFLPATSPLRPGRNVFYKDNDAFHYAVADAMRDEYRAIVAAGFIVQIDDPRLPGLWESQGRELSVAEYRKMADAHVELVNHALKGIPEERVRYHICWGSWHGPHSRDLPIQYVADIMMKINAQGYLFEAANSRHEHEWQVWKDVKIPEGKILIPGIVAHATNVVEHPELVAWRIKLFADIVGRENVMAGSDCGLGYRVHPQLAWAKLKTLAEGAKLASAQLWKRS